MHAAAARGVEVDRLIEACLTLLGTGNAADGEPTETPLTWDAFFATTSDIDIGVSRAEKQRGWTRDALYDRPIFRRH